jgi:hypothetical protein
MVILTMGWPIFLPTNLPTHSQNNHQKTENSKIYKGFVDSLKKKTENTKIYNGLVVFKLPNHYIYQLFQAFWINKPTTPKESLPPQYILLIQILFKFDENPLWSLPPIPIYIPYSILIQN